ncbi:MAG TPA: hypothetical protein VFL66_10365 [Gaiellaceae bacterium]|nr:hypothetical protein [Gaiellaceae bacterium]
MNAYKFLAAGAVGRFSDVPWPQPPLEGDAEWLEADGPPEQCRHGVHACEVDRLLDWIDEELWEVELDGVAEREPLLVAARGRLRRRVPGWDEDAARDFADACAERVREHAAAAVDSVAKTLTAFAADCRLLARGARPDAPDAPDVPASAPAAAAIAANLGFVAAHAAGFAAASGSADDERYTAGFLAERSWQLDWLRRRLAL